MIPVPVAFIGGLVITFGVMWEAFESIILPRRVTRKLRLTRLFYRTIWSLWKFAARLITAKKARDSLLGYFGPISLLLLLACWAASFILSFALMQYGAGSAINPAGLTPGFVTDLYLSGTTFFTLGLGDVLPRSGLARLLTVVESGVGFGFFAIVIGYLPVIYQSFSRREANISLLDSRAGSPPTAGELLRRHSYPGGLEALRELLKEWEHWSADILESHLSYPVVAYYRSQHDNQSWISALTAVLDTCALLKAGIEGACERQAELTFAIARHAVVDLAQVFTTSPQPPPEERLTPADAARIRETLAQHGLRLREGEETYQRLAELRRMYEPYVYTLATYLNLSLPPWIPSKKGKDNWQTTAWARAAGGIQEEVPAAIADDHS